MSAYGDLEERLLREFKSSTRESIEDVALDEDEKIKLIYNLSGTYKSQIPELRVDYSDFSNHVFFGSAYSSVSFALKRLLDYPIDGETKDIEDWKNINSGYENWFYDNFPKDHGHAYFESGSASEVSVFTKDFENKANFSSGKFTLEAVIKPWADIVAGPFYPIMTVGTSSAGLISLRLMRESDDKYLQISFGKDAVVELSTSYAEYISGTFHVAATYNQDILKFFVDGEEIFSASVNPATVGTDFDFGSKDIHIGKSFFGETDVNHYYSGSIDEVRIWGTSRPKELLKKNFKRPIKANKSGSLYLYYKFNEPYLTSSNKIIDYSGNGLEGQYSGSYDFSLNYVSGNIENYITDSGDLILDVSNGRVNSFISEQRESGSAFDKENPNYIFELVPSFMIDDDGTEDQKKFLLLIARHWDRLKLYIKHFSYVYNTSIASYNDTPNDFLNFVAKHYGLDIGDVYSSSNVFQSIYGENVLQSGSMETSLSDVGNTIKRNILNNLIYFYKTKSTREAVKSALRALGLNDEVVSVNQYSIFSDGIETKYEPKLVERRVLNFDGQENQYLNLHSSSYSDVDPRTYQFRVSLDSGSYFQNNLLTSSVFRIQTTNSSSVVMDMEIRRENLSSSLGRLILRHSGAAATSQTLTSDLFPAYTNKWFNVVLFRKSATPLQSFGYRVNSLGPDNEIDLALEDSYVYSFTQAYNPDPDDVSGIRFGTIAGKPFHGKMNEVRVWNKILTSSVLLESHTKDFESLELENFFEEIGNGTLLSHLKLNDFTASISTDQIHDYLDGKSGSNFSGFSTSSLHNFPGVYLKKLQPSYSYDFNIDNDKIRIRDTDVFSSADITEDVQFVTVDFSPSEFLNKEIIKWFGGIEKFSNIVGFPYLKYRDNISKLDSYRAKFFAERMNDGISFEKYLNIIKWFDSNFSYFLNQLMPLDLNSSISNFVVEPHMLEHNKVKHIFPYFEDEGSRVLESSIIVTREVVADSLISVPIMDPGRFGSFMSFSANSQDIGIAYSTGSESVNYKDSFFRKFIRGHLADGAGTGLNPIYGNGYWTTSISCSNYEREILNLNTNFHISGVHYPGGSADSAYLSSSYNPMSEFTGAILNTAQDARWQWYHPHADTHAAPEYDFGIGYGGGIGQLWGFCNKSKFGLNKDFNNQFFIGDNTTWDRAEPVSWITSDSNVQSRKTVILWPEKDSFNGTRIVAVNPAEILVGIYDDGKKAALGFGPVIDIEDFTNLNLTIAGNVNRVANRYLVAYVKFQFFDDESGEVGFESIMSSSLTAGQYTTTNVPHTYILPVPWAVAQGTPASESFLINIERELPRTKKMRIHFTAFVSNGTETHSTTNAIYTVVVKGTLSKGERSKDILMTRGL